jgi:HPt (histidine-containing phosphotransfer) domain-containing protein
MNTRKRTTLYFEAELHKALRRRAAAGDRPVSDLVNEAVRAFLAEDLADLSEVTQQLNSVHEAPSVDTGLDPVLAELQSATLARHADH